MEQLPGSFWVGLACACGCHPDSGGPLDVTAAPPADAATEAEAKLAAIREWVGGLGWLGSPQDERVEAEALAILDGVTRWRYCPDYIRGLPHTECSLCGGFGAVPAPSTDPWRACGCADPDNCEHVFHAPAPSAKEGSNG